MIPEDKIADIKYVEEQIIANREYSVAHREEIGKYAAEFDWPTVVDKYYIPAMQTIIDGAK